MAKRYYELLRILDGQCTRVDKAEVSNGSSRASSGSGHGSDDNDGDSTVDSLEELEHAMEELRRRIAHPGYYRRLADQRIYDQPSEVLQAREKAGARALAEYLASLPKS
jgi:ribosomal protein S21